MKIISFVVKFCS